jgi:uncharacterized protein
MKLSKYNVYVPLNSPARMAVYNTWSGRYCTLPMAIGKALKRQQESGVLDRGCVRMLGGYRDLVTSGILIPDDLDEESVFQRMHDQVKNAEDCLKVLAVLTLNCDFHCQYCYQGPRKFARTSMTMKTASALVKFVGNQLKTKKIKTLIIGLYGGEPLLMPEVGNFIVEGVSRLTAGKGIHVEFSLTTNGNRLLELYGFPLVKKSTAVHLTLDGNRKIHDSVRRTADGEPSYDRILDGLRKLVSANKKITVRIHSNRLNNRQLKEVLDDLSAAGLKPESKATIYLMPISRPCAGRDKGCGEEELQASRAQLLHTAKLLANLPAHPLASLFSRQFHSPVVPLPIRAMVCEYEHIATYTINWNGNVMICPTLGGIRRIVGKLTSRGTIAGNAQSRQFDRDARHRNSACRICPYLPACGGPCLLYPKPKRLEECRESPADYHALVTRYVKHAESQRNAAGVGKRRSRNDT